jgi:predicted phage tail protein
MTISGNKGDSGSQRTPIEAPDSLVSTGFARILDLISEGPIVGLANGLKSVYFDRTPLQNADGTLNFKNVQVEVRLGTQDQTYIPGFAAVESETGVGVELVNGAPWTRAFTNLQLSGARVLLGVPQLTKVNKENGDVNGTTVQYAIDLAVDGGAFVEVYRNAFTGKTTSNYQRSHRIDFPPAAVSGWQLRVRRITPTAPDSSTQDKVYVQSFTEIIDGKFTYPNSACVGVSIDSSQFGAIPQRGYEVYGRIVRVPSNYNPVTRVYTGLWDGTFVLAWTNNPAWVYYDLITHPRYGLGQWIDELSIDKWGLYDIGVYCDELVPDGKGGMEPRFTCTTQIQTRQDAYNLMRDMVSVFRGMQFYTEGGVLTVSDKPEDAEVLYTNANVVDGIFEYTGSSRRSRHSVVSVSWSDPDNFGQLVPETVEDPDSIERFGINELAVTAFGCNSQGQAHRAGRYILATERFESGGIGFKVGLDGTFVVPGRIVRVADSLRAGIRLGGRIVGYFSDDPIGGDFITDESGEVITDESGAPITME